MNSMPPQKSQGVEEVTERLIALSFRFSFSHLVTNFQLYKGQLFVDGWDSVKTLLYQLHIQEIPTRFSK